MAFKYDKCNFINLIKSFEKNISAKEFHKHSKYKVLEIEITIIWHLNTTIIPLVIGLLGMIKKNIYIHSEKILGYPYLSEMQKIILMSILILLLIKTILPQYTQKLPPKYHHLPEMSGEKVDKGLNPPATEKS